MTMTGDPTPEPARTTPPLLTPEQQAEVKALYDAGDLLGAQRLVLEAIEQLTPEQRADAVLGALDGATAMLGVIKPPDPRVRSTVPLTPTTDGVTPVRSFSRTRAEPIPFDVDGEVFFAVPEMAGGSLIDVAATARLPKDQRMEALATFLDGALTVESGQRFAARLRNPDNPVTLDQLADVVAWLTEEVYQFATPTGAPSGS